MTVAGAADLPGGRPSPACPKCGQGDGFLFAIPEYDADTVASSSGAVYVRAEWLEWRCRVCRFLIRTKTADAR